MNKTPKKYSLLSSEDTVSIGCPLDEGREYILGVLFMVLLALICILFCYFIFYTSFLLHFEQLNCKFLVLSVAFFVYSLLFKLLMFYIFYYAYFCLIFHFGKA